MKIVLIGSGNLSIPPPGWGAVEILIWDIYENLVNNGNIVHIINTRNQNEIIRITNEINPDIVHLHVTGYVKLLQLINCKIKILTNHEPDINSDSLILDSNIINNPTIFISALSREIKDIYIKAGWDTNKIFITPNGANEKNFVYSDNCIYPDKSIYLAMIEDTRKNQYKYQTIDSIYFAGNVWYTTKFDTNNPRYLGHWSKDTVYSSLTHYANLVLLSTFEAHSLAVCEALISGLGVVISEAACANLDLTKPWITVIPNNKLDDLIYIEDQIKKNREISLHFRSEIRSHSLETISWKSRINNIYELYINLLQDSLEPIVPIVPIVPIESIL